MRYPLFLGAAIVALTALGAGNALAQGDDPVAEQCRQDLVEFNDIAISAPDQSPIMPLGTDRELRTLRHAALVFAQNGDEEACQMVLAEMRDLYEIRRAEAMAARPADATPEMDAEERSQRLASATSVSEMPGMIQFDEVVGIDVYSLQDEYLGELETVIINPSDASVAFALIASGGFIGMGEDMIPVPWDTLQVTQDGETYVLNVSEQTFDGAPTLGGSEYSDAVGQEWIDRIDSWWQENTSS